jgi:hypothetical protein
VLRSVDVDPGLRGEALNVEDFARIAAAAGAPGRPDSIGTS